MLKKLKFTRASSKWDTAMNKLDSYSYGSINKSNNPKRMTIKKMLQMWFVTFKSNHVKENKAIK